MTALATDLVKETAVPDSPKAWRMAGAAFTAGFVVLGIVYSFGVFLQPMTDEFGVGRAAASAFMRLRVSYGTCSAHSADM